MFQLKDNSVNVYPCGIIISPEAPWIAASPDRRVVDPARQPPFGLLEIKVSQAIDLNSVDCLRKAGEKYELKRNHNYYYQIQCQLAVTGLLWCDLMVYLSNSPQVHHMEEVKFDPSTWQSVKDKLDFFYFSYFL